MATVSFTVAQAVAAAEAAERGLERRAAAGSDTGGLTPIVVLMIGRLDDWMKVLVERDGLAVDPAAPNWAGHRGLQADLRPVPGARLPFPHCSRRPPAIRCTGPSSWAPTRR